MPAQLTYEVRGCSPRAVSACVRQERTGEVPDGDVGTFFTLELMRATVLADVGAPLLVQTARSIVSGAGHPLKGIRAIRRYLSERVRFTRDPATVELLQSPRYQLSVIQARGTVPGDCDDIAILGAALGLAAGFPARFKVLRFDKLGPFEHVYTELRGPTGWIELDTSREAQRVPPSVQPAAVETFDVGAPGNDVRPQRSQRSIGSRHALRVR